MAEKVMARTVRRGRLLIVVLLLASPCAWADWGSFVLVGTARGVGDPSCTGGAPPAHLNTIVCAARSDTSAMMVNVYNGKWGKWANLAGTINSDPVCTVSSTNLVICVARAISGGMEVATYNGSAWDTPQVIGTGLYSAPSCAPSANGEVLCAAQSQTGGMLWTLYNGTKWSSFKTLATVMLSAPSCSNDSATGVVCVFFTGGGNTIANHYAAGVWEGFLQLGGSAAGNPSCSVLSMDPNQMACVARGYNSFIYVDIYHVLQGWAPAAWSGYQILGGAVTDNASCANLNEPEATAAVCGVITEFDQAFYGTLYTGTWTPWALVGSTGVGAPSCASYLPTEAVCVFRNIANQYTSVTYTFV